MYIAFSKGDSPKVNFDHILVVLYQAKFILKFENKLTDLIKDAFSKMFHITTLHIK